MIGITGVTGHIGQQVAQHLTDLGIEHIELARRPERVPARPGVVVRQASYEMTPATVAALQGIETLFMVSAHEDPARIKQHQAFIDAAKQAGVKQMVYLSFYGASPTATFTFARDHAATEQYLQAQGFTYTFVRDNFYADFFVELAQEYHELRGPAGNGKIAPVFQSDVAAVVATIMAHPAQFANQTLNLTGGKEYTLAEMSELFTKSLGQPAPYIDETVAEAYASRQAWPAQPWEYDAWVSTYTSIANGENAGVSPDVATVLGRPAVTLEAYLATLPHQDRVK